MAWKLKIGGVDYTDSVSHRHGVEISRPLNGRPAARFTMLPPLAFLLPALIPDRFAEVQIYARDGTTLIFGGVILKRTVTGFIPGAKPSYCDVECGGYETYADWRYITADFTVAVTLKDALDYIVSNYLTDYGTTLDPAQVTGPTLDPFRWDTLRISDALRALMAMTPDGEYVYWVDAQNRLRAFVPGTDAAPTGVADHGTPFCRDVTWTDSDKQPANKIIVACGPIGGQILYTGQRTADGVATSWQFELLGVTAPWSILVGGVFKTVTPIGGGGQFEWDPTTYTLHVGTDPVPVATTVIEVSYWAATPFLVTATSGATPVIEYRKSEPGVIDLVAGHAIADGLLVQLDQQPRELTIDTVDYAGWDAGQSLTVNVDSSRFGPLGAPLDCIITRVSISLISDEFWRYMIDATESLTYTGGYLERWRELGLVAQ